MLDILPHRSMANEPSDFRTKATTHMAALESWMAPFFEKTPHLPNNARESIVKVAPWIALIVGIFGLFSVFPILSSVFMLASLPYARMMGGWYPAILVSLAFLVVGSVIDLLAFKPLSDRRKKGWNLLFYGTCLGFVSTLVDMFSGSPSLSGVVGTLIGLWLLFEIRGLYKA